MRLRIFGISDERLIELVTDVLLMLRPNLAVVDGSMNDVLRRKSLPGRVIHPGRGPLLIVSGDKDHIVPGDREGRVRIIGRMRERVAATDEPDLVTQNLLISVTADLEKRSRMFQAEQ